MIPGTKRKITTCLFKELQGEGTTKSIKWFIAETFGNKKRLRLQDCRAILYSNNMFIRNPEKLPSFDFVIEPIISKELNHHTGTKLLI